VVASEGTGGSPAEMHEVACERCHLYRWNQRGIPGRGGTGGFGRAWSALNRRGSTAPMGDPPPEISPSKERLYRLSTTL
jgi:hypothetical protein